MSYSLLAHLYPRIRGSQEDIATYALVYILEQSAVLNEAFTKLISKKMEIEGGDVLSYHSQEAKEDTGRPDIAGYKNGSLHILCEAKFYAGLTSNQPVSYIQRLLEEGGKGLIFISPQNRIIPMWGKICEECENSGIGGTDLKEDCRDINGVRMSIASWQEILSELVRVSIERDPERLGDVRQLQGFCEKVESDAFNPFRPEDFGVQTARDMDRYYQVVDEVHKRLQGHKELEPSTKGLRSSPKWHGYSQYLKIDNVAISVNFLRKLWKEPTSVETPFWLGIQEIIDGGWRTTDKVIQFMVTVDEGMKGDFYGAQYIALVPKPYVDLDELSENLEEQVLRWIRRFKDYKDAR